MTDADLLAALVQWTPYLLRGFAWNILIGLNAMVLGTLAGAAVASLRVARGRWRRRAGTLAMNGARNIPTIVFQFYLVLMLPSALTLPGGLVLPLPPWWLASVALAVAVVGFTADNLAHAWTQWRAGDRHAALLFVPSWSSYLLIIVIASSTASIIGVDELVTRCNVVVSATGETSLMLPLYAYACAIFFGFCFPLTLLLRHLQRRLQSRRW
jgi:polar amino acid transport system permease protein